MEPSTVTDGREDFITIYTQLLQRFFSLNPGQRDVSWIQLAADIAVTCFFSQRLFDELSPDDLNEFFVLESEFHQEVHERKNDVPLREEMLKKEVWKEQVWKEQEVFEVSSASEDSESVYSNLSDNSNEASRWNFF